jgi:heme-degrading monooxygenase HmoA
VIFTSKRTGGDHDYHAMSQKMVELSAGRDGFLGMESVRGADGVGITVSYWRDA